LDKAISFVILAKNSCLVHFVHSILPFCHSYNNAIVKNIRNKRINILFFKEGCSKGYARTSEISTSKIKNNKAIRKNWKEKGR